MPRASLRPPRRPLRAALLALAALLPLHGPAARSQPATPRAAAEAERRAAAARAGAEEAARAAALAAEQEARLAERRVALGQRAQAAERRVAEAEARAAAAAAAAQAAREEAAARAEALGPLLPVIQRLALWPAESLLAVPAPPEDALTGLLVLQGLARDVAQQAAALRAAAARARDRAAEAAAEGREVAAAETAARTAAAALDAELQAAARQRAAAEDEAEAATRRAAESAARATTLREALARLERAEARRQAEAARQQARAAAAARPTEPRSAEPAAASTPGRGRALPVVGRVLRGFGAAGEDGLPSRGITWQAAPGARVVSPCAGRVAFAAPFRSYGQLLILDCGEGQHFVLSGLGRIDVAAGRRVLAGEPVGQLAADPGAARPGLYGELRLRGRPADPAPWLAAGGG